MSDKIKNLKDFQGNKLIEETEETARETKGIKRVNIMLTKYNPVMYNNRLYLKVDDRYTSDHNEIMAIIMIEFKVMHRTAKELYKSIIPLAKKIETEEAQKFKIKLKNGYLFKGKYYTNKTDDFTVYNLNKIEYIENAKRVKAVDEYINHLTYNDDDYKALLFEILGHGLIIDSLSGSLGQVNFFVGDGGNGKGTLLKVIASIFNNNFTANSIENLEDSKYINAMQNKLYNLGDDVENSRITANKMKNLKNLATQDDTAHRSLFSNDVNTISNTATLLFTSNHILYSDEKGESWKRRVKWLPMDNEVKNKNPMLLSELTTPEAKTYIFSLIVDGYKRLYRNKQYTTVERVKKFNRSYHIDNNSILQYIENEEFEAKDFIRRTPKDCYDSYVNYFNEYNKGEKIQPMKKSKFIEFICTTFKLEVTKGRDINSFNSTIFNPVDNTEVE